MKAPQCVGGTLMKEGRKSWHWRIKKLRRYEHLDTINQLSLLKIIRCACFRDRRRLINARRRKFLGNRAIALRPRNMSSSLLKSDHPSFFIVCCPLMLLCAIDCWCYLLVLYLYVIPLCCTFMLYLDCVHWYFTLILYINDVHWCCTLTLYLNIFTCFVLLYLYFLASLSSSGCPCFWPALIFQQPFDFQHLASFLPVFPYEKFLGTTASCPWVLGRHTI